MKYKVDTIKISDLIAIIDKNEIDLKPFYQRNDIWSPKDQNELIDSLLKGYPIPNFFFYDKLDGTYEMVDGQQRARTIYRFIKGIISSSRETGKKFYTHIDQKSIDNYEISVTYIFDVADMRSLQDFYVLVNKKGKHLNTAELNKADYAHTNFLKLVEEIIEDQKFIDIELFTDTIKKRMTDRSYVEELIAYLKFGITDKKISAQKLFEKDITEEESRTLKMVFFEVLDRIIDLNNSTVPLKKTRYKQRNDFYTLFCFVHENLEEDFDVLDFQYNILIAFDRLNIIRPSIDECEPLKSYALNCVSQSNSKNARVARLNFFNLLLKNKKDEISDSLKVILQYLDEIMGRDKVDLKVVGNYRLIDYKKLN